jgi:two-component system sensor histidine kinase KdpD
LNDSKLRTSAPSFLATGSYRRRSSPLLRYSLAVTSVALAVAVLELLGPQVYGPAAAQVLLLVLIVDGWFFGTGPAVVASLCATAGFWRYFVTPTGFAFGDRGDWAQLLSFIILAVVVGELASRAERRAREAQAGRQEITRLYQELEAAFDRASEAEALRRNEQLKAALLDALSHNLRTPLTAIKASVTALIGASAVNTDAALSREGRDELLAIIDEESDRLNRFIEGLSMAGTDAQALTPKTIGIDEVLRAGLSRAETLTRDYRVEVDIAAAPPLVSVDPASMVEVLYIVLDNASKYAPPGSTIRVSAVVAGRNVELSIEDEGPGIPEASREQVFEKFYRIPGRQSHDPRRKGIGLGLPIARRLVEAQGGHIWVESSSTGKGTVVRANLPIAEPVSQTHVTHAPTATPPVGVV